MSSVDDSPGPDNAPTLVDRLLVIGELPVRAFDRLPERLQDRLVGAALFFPGASVLATAAMLTPDPSGMGTHRQLGMSGCTVLVLTGYPCPMCGMTTTFAHFAHLHLLQGLANQPFGLILFSATVIATALGGLDLLAPRRRWRAALRMVERYETAVALTLLIGMFAGWVYKVALVRGFLPWGP